MRDVGFENGFLIKISLSGTWRCESVSHLLFSIEQS